MDCLTPEALVTEAAPEMKRRRIVNQKVAGGKTCGKAQSSGKRLDLQPTRTRRSKVRGCASVGWRESNSHRAELCCRSARSMLRMERQDRQQRQPQDPSTQPHSRSPVTREEYHTLWWGNRLDWCAGSSVTRAAGTSSLFSLHGFSEPPDFDIHKTFENAKSSQEDVNVFLSHLCATSTDAGSLAGPAARPVVCRTRTRTIA